jgi:hypothetical protein
MFLPRLGYQYLALGQLSRQFPVQQFIPHLAIEGLNSAILPGLSHLDEQSLDPEPAQPFPDRPRRELTTVVGAYMVRGSPEEEIEQGVEDRL